MTGELFGKLFTMGSAGMKKSMKYLF